MTFSFTWPTLYASCQTSLICPSPADVTHSVSATTKHQERLVERFHELDTVGVPCEASGNGQSLSCCCQLTAHRQIEASQLVARERICAALQYDGTWVVRLHDLSNDLSIIQLRVAESDE